MLSNAYFVAKFRFDTAENEPAKNLQKFRRMRLRKMHFSKVHFRKMHALRDMEASVMNRPQVAATKDWVQKALQDHEGVLVGGVAAQPGYVVDEEGVGELLWLFNLQARTDFSNF